MVDFSKPVNPRCIVFLRMIKHRNEPRHIRLALAQHHMLSVGIVPPIWHTRMVLRAWLEHVEEHLGVANVGTRNKAKVAGQRGRSALASKRLAVAS